MSGVEILGIISGVITIIDATGKVYHAAKDEAGLPHNFKAVATKLPLISRLLEDAKRYVDEEADDTLTSTFTPTLQACQANAAQLHQLFEKVIPADADSRIQRYLKAAQIIGKGGRVETLMKGILESIQLLTAGFPKPVASRGQENLNKAIEEVNQLEPSLPDGFENAPTFANYGSGAQSASTGPGNQYNINSSGNQYIGTNHIGMPSQSISFKP